MKNRAPKFKLKSYVNPLKPTILSFSKWNSLHLQAKIQKYGNVSAYLDYLIERYSYRIYQGYVQTDHFCSAKYQIKPNEHMLIKCEIYESTLNELVELAKIASISKRKLIQLLVSWDINPPTPCYSMAL